MSQKITRSTFIIVSNGFADGPSQALRDYLIEHDANEVITVSHPLVAEGAAKHEIVRYKSGKIDKKEIKLPNKPPYTFALDPFVPMHLPYATAWFGFNNLVAYRGLIRKRKNRTEKVFYWAVDFVPQRFGNGILTKIYDRLDRRVARAADARIELSEAALNGRAEYLGLDQNNSSPGLVVPMGAWLGRTPKANQKAKANPKLVYLGHLVERQGVATLISAMAILAKHYPKLGAEIIGSGPLEADLRKQAKNLNLNNVKFHGFVKDHGEVERILASGSIAVAPYKKDKDSFTQYADPGKLKAYLGAGLPIVLTDVPPNAHELEKNGVAIIVDDSPEALAAGIAKMLNGTDWDKYHKAAINYAKQFDWEVILKKALNSLGFN